MSVRRLGGGYGSKLQHPSRISGAASVAALALNRPVRLVLGIQTNMTLLGGRIPYLIQYQVTCYPPHPVPGDVLSYLIQYQVTCYPPHPVPGDVLSYLIQYQVTCCPTSSSTR